MGFLEVCDLTAGNYTVTESLGTESTGQYHVVSSMVNGTSIEPTAETVTIMWNSGGSDLQTVVWTNAAEAGGETGGETGDETSDESCSETGCG